MTADTDALAGFAALMSGAATEAKPDDPAPYGYTRDPKTGEERPKKAPGRPRKSPSLEDLKAAKAESDSAAGDSVPSGAAGSSDRPPAAIKRRRGGRRATGKEDPKPAPPTPQYLRNEGGIAKAVNRSYRKMGKLCIAMGVEPEGRALIAITRAEDEDDVTVGDAWEQLAKTNPRVRAFLLRMLSGGAWSTLIMVHLPVAGAFLMREGVRSRIPFGRLMGAFLADEGDGDGAPADGTPFDGLRPEDMQAMAAAMAASFEQARGNGVPGRGE